MRKTSLALNSITALFFAFFIAYSFFGHEHLTALARDFVTSKTLEYSNSVVSLAEKGLESAIVKTLLKAEQIATIRNEIKEYRQDRSGYIADLTRQKIRQSAPPKGNPLVAQVLFVKERIRDYYDSTLKALMIDLRIFSFSNLFAAILAWWLTYRSTEAIHRTVAWFSILMFAAVVYSSMVYVDEMGFFTILFRSHMGWWYPVLLCSVLGSIYMKYGKLVDDDEQRRPVN